MKKNALLYAVLAMAAMGFTSCQKEESATLTFAAQTETSNDKTALNSNYYFEWESTDQVEIFNASSHATFSVTPRTDRIWADLVGENIGEAPYTAIYPASIATSSASEVTLPDQQTTTDGTLHNFPMMATTTTSQMFFTNLSSAIRIRLPQGADKLQRIEVVTDQPISGRCTIGTYTDGNPYAVATSDGSKFASLVVTQPSDNTNDEYCIALPAGTYHDFDIRLYSTNGTVCSKTIANSNGINLVRNHITTFEFASATFETEKVARLLRKAFSSITNPKKIVFHYHSDVTSTTELQNDDLQSEKIYGVQDGDVYHVYTPAHYIYAPEDGSNLFSLGNGSTTPYNLEAVEFGHYFRTDETTNMNSMFYGDNLLTALDLSSFNTQNVTDMGKMFEGCSNITKLDLTSFSSNSVERMYKIFQWCERMTSIKFNSEFTAPNQLMATQPEPEVDDWGLSRVCLQLGTAVAGGCTIYCNTETRYKFYTYGGGMYSNSVHFSIIY